MKASSTSFRFAAAAAALAVGWMLLLPWLLPVDEMVYRWAQTDAAAALAERADPIGWVVGFVLLGISLVAAIFLPAGRRHEIVTGVAAVAGAALFSELLKTGFERLRPRTVPLIATGNSFPSGHVMTTTVGALVACALVAATSWPTRWKRAAYVLAASCVLAQAWDRIAMEAHWLSDVPASVLFAIAWFLATPALLVQPPRRLAVGTLAFGLAYLAMWVDPDLRLRLPTASAADAGATWKLDVSDPGAHDRLVGWTPATEGTLGAVAWCHETASAIPVDHDVTGGSILKLMLRPPDCGQRQRRVDMRLTVSLAGRDVATLGVRRGWREYRVAVPDDVRLARGDRIGLRFDAEPGSCPSTTDPGVAAFRYLKIVPAT